MLRPLRPSALVVGAALCVALATPGPARAHGLWGHVHVTGWAVENMPDDELRAFLLDDPEVFNALLFGAVFTDTGYALDEPAARAYSEHAHWEPFIQDYVAWMQANDPPPWDSLESRKRVAFLMGCASHGLQDTLFDSLFLHQVEERDGVGQSETDPGTDGFLAVDGHLRFVPERDLPLDTLLELTADLDADVTADVIDRAVSRVTDAYINDGVGLSIAQSLGQTYADTMPWGRQHYLDPDVPGSLRAEVFPTMAYQQAIWARLHDGLPADDPVTFAFPEAPRRLRSGDPAVVDSWVSLVFGQGVSYDPDLLELVDEAGAPVAFTAASNRWGADPTRLVRLQPDEALTPGGWYTARLRAGAQTIDGQTSTAAATLRFQVACDTADDPACPDLGELPVADIDGLDEPVEPDGAGGADSGAPSAAGSATASGCGCATARPTPLGWLGLVGLSLFGAARRRR